MSAKALRASFALAIFGFVAESAVLPPGKISLRQALFYNFATVLFAPDPTDTGGKLFTLAEKTSAAFGLRYGLQLDLSLAYAETKLTGATLLNRSPQSVVSGISEIGFQATKRIYPKRATDIESFELSLYAGMRVPGNPQHTPFDLLALNDGAIKGDFGSLLSFYFSPVSLLLDMRYVARGGSMTRDQAWVSLTIPIELAPGLQIGAQGTFVYTFGGFDIFSTEWFAAQAELGGNRIPYPYVREQYLGGGGFLVLALSDEWSLDAFGFSKFWGRNTDKSTTFGIAVNYTF